MNLTWHIVLKDLRRMAWPVGAWVAFVAMAAGWFGAMHMREEAVRAEDFYGWINGVGGFTWWMTAMQVVTSALLAAHLILEDQVTGTTAHWLTRPIAPVRMLAAKIVAGLLLFVLAPLAGLAPVWWSQGFSLREVALAAVEFATWQTGLMALTFSIASLSKNLAQFFFVGAGALVAAMVSELVIRAVWRDRNAFNGDAGRAWLWLLLVLPVLFMTRITVHQYLTRQTRRGWLTVAAGGAALFVLRAVVPDSLMQWAPPPRTQMRAEAMPDGRLAQFVAVKNITTPLNRDHPLTTLLAIGHTTSAHDLLAPEQTMGAEVRFPDKRRVSLWMSPGPLWGQDAAKRIAGLARGEGPVAWSMVARFGAPVYTPRIDEASWVSGMMRVARMRGRVLAEVPWLAGGRARSGSSELRIVGLRESGGRYQPCVIVEERDSLFVCDVGLTVGRGERQRNESRRDCYLLVNRALGIIEGLRVIELGSANMCSMLVSTRRLEFAVPTRFEGGQRIEVPGWIDGAVLIKVRFELEGRVLTNFKTERVPLIVEDDK